MKVTVTHLKAPWPAGTVPGHVVDVQAASLPGCFAGKCNPAADDAEAASVWTPPEPVAGIEETAPAAPVAAAANADDLTAARALQKAAEEEADELRATVERQAAALAEKDQALNAATAQVEALQKAAEQKAADKPAKK